MLSAEERLSGLGGSEIGVVVGLSKYRTRDELLQEKLGLLPPQEERWMMWWGLGQEDFVFDTLEHRPHYVTPEPEGLMEVVRKPRTLRHRDIPWMFASADGYGVMQDGSAVLLEVKTAAIKRDENWGKCGTADAPAAYVAQTLWNTGVARSHGKDIREAWILALFGNREPQRYVIPWDEGRFNWLAAEGAKFWAEVESKRKAVAA